MSPSYLLTFVVILQGHDSWREGSRSWAKLSKPKTEKLTPEEAVWEVGAWQDDPGELPSPQAPQVTWYLR